ncbi:unnamed protein product [Camellia sinensis]
MYIPRTFLFQNSKSSLGIQNQPSEIQLRSFPSLRRTPKADSFSSDDRRADCRLCLSLSLFPSHSTDDSSPPPLHADEEIIRKYIEISGRGNKHAAFASALGSLTWEKPLYFGWCVLMNSQCGDQEIPRQVERELLRSMTEQVRAMTEQQRSMTEQCFELCFVD